MCAAARGTSRRRACNDQKPIRFGRRKTDRVVVEREDMSWDVLPRAARVCVALVMLTGTAALVALAPRTYPQPALCAVALAARSSA